MLKWLVIGVGDIARKRVLPAIQDAPGSRLHAILTRDPAKAEPYSEARVYTDLVRALADPDVDAVYVASPVALHAPQTLAALRAGKHVLCEKPVALNYTEAHTMAAAAHEVGRILGVAYYRRLYPKVQRAMELLAQGCIGQPTFAVACYHGWLESPIGDPFRGWLKDPSVSGGGPFYDVASHRIDLCNLFFGRPLRATGLLANAVHQMAVEDSGTAVIEYNNGLHAAVDARWNSHVTRDEFRIVGVDGELDLSPLNSPRLRWMLSSGEVREEDLPAAANVHLPLIEDFASALLLEKSVACPIDEAIQTDWVTERVFRPHLVG